jgi:hypothetical protein
LNQKKQTKIVENKEDDFIYPAKTVNTLARKKFQAHLLKEIMFDLMVCAICIANEDELPTLSDSEKNLLNGFAVNIFNKHFDI